MAFGLRAIRKRSTAFHDQVDGQAPPRQSAQVADLTDGNPVTADKQIAAGFLHFDRSQKAPMGTVIAGQMGKRFNVGKIVV